MEYLIDDISDYQLDETESHEIFLLKKLALNSKHSQDIYSFLHSLYDVGKSSLKSSKSDCLFVCSAVEVIDSVIKRS
jgi:hypothetical protein